MTNKYLQKIRNRLSGPIGHGLIRHRQDDTYIAAFPRSGSTWLRTMLVNVLDESAQSNPDAFNSRIPAVSIRNYRLIESLASPRTIMTHSCWRPSMKKAVYLVRDGRDSLVSSYHYHITRVGRAESFESYYDLYKSEVFGLTWSMHTATENIGTKLLKLSFEDLKTDTDTHLSRVCDFLEIKVTNRQLRKAIELASLERARKIEEERDGPMVNENTSFYRKGSSNQWQDAKYLNVIKRFEKEEGWVLEAAGYAVEKSTTE